MLYYSRRLDEVRLQNLSSKEIEYIRFQSDDYGIIFDEIWE